ncbi:MAG: family 78 glycoside hydrolase catalytic domain [Clostridia bacterium]|nr:family 78 glycoside hydrolase catalytic domain [Clostridia bacterium]
MRGRVNEKISNAKWVVAPRDMASPIIERKFEVTGENKAILAVSALGFFIPYVNGKRVGDDYFKPAGSLYHDRDHSRFTYPIRDKFTYRCYYTVYDVSSLIREGENLLAIHIGDGWYRQYERTDEGEVSFGDSLGAIFAVGLGGDVGERWLLSDGSEVCRESEIRYSQLFYGEHYDARLESKRLPCFPVKSIDIDTVLTLDDAPADRVVRRVVPRLVCEDDGRRIFDTGENISGFVRIKTAVKDGECVRIRFAEIYEEGKLNFTTTGSLCKTRDGRAQIGEDVFFGDGGEHIYEPRFVWHAFRYFEIEGDADVVDVAVVHSDVERGGEFECSDSTLNWLVDAFIRTQLGNMHCGFPSDCPHRERLGYTGDGQVAASAAMLFFDGRDFYRKWIRDIFDSQDTVTGHVNHTAPFAGGGGGPGGWGMAAITVPYNYYRIYGDLTPATEQFDCMMRWVEYLLQHSEGGLVVREEEGGWCLGDWCTLYSVQIPEPYVNTCLFIRGLDMLADMASRIGRNDAQIIIEAARSAAAEGVVRAYYSKDSGSFAGGVQGADALALCIGLGDERTAENLHRKYSEIGKFDTGFITTPILAEFIMKRDPELALRMITSCEGGGFGYMRDRGATTVWEHWLGEGSHNHPMFGAVVAVLLETLLGIEITPEAHSGRIRISPSIPRSLEWARGSVLMPQGRVRVEFYRKNGEICFVISLPDGTCGELLYGDSIPLREGENKITVRDMKEEK